MKEYLFKKIDAFATKNSSGNPAGYIWLDSLQNMTESEMLQIAKELKGFVNEVGYIAQLGESEFKLKYYSSEREVDFCGHATIAILYDIIKTKEGFSDFDYLYINTNKGRLRVDNRLSQEDAVFIMSPIPKVNDEFPPKSEIAENLNISIGEMDESLPIALVNAGLSTLIVPIRNLSSILKIKPDLEALKVFCFASGIDIIEVFTSEVIGTTNNYRTRVFAPTFGYIEDPATGSGNSALGYYLIDNNLWKGETINIEQNGELEKFNIVKLQKNLDAEGFTRVSFGGGAISRIIGKYQLH